MFFYKMRHIPTGLFYKPSRYPYKVNLSKNGKTYHRKPTFEWIGSKYRHPVEKGWEWREFIPAEWEIVSYETAEER